MRTGRKHSHEKSLSGRLVPTGGQSFYNMSFSQDHLKNNPEPNFTLAYQMITSIVSIAIGIQQVY